MSDQPSRDEGGRRHVVRPRWTWLAVGLLLAGVALIGWGIIVTSWTPAVIGTVVLVIGVGAAIRGGLLYDVHSTASPRAELHEIVHGEQYDAPDPAVTLTPEEVQREVRRTRGERGES